MVSVDLTVFPAVPKVNILLLLGVDFLTANKIELCIKRTLLIKHLEDGGTVKFYLDKLGKTSQEIRCDIVCRAASSVKINSGTVKYVPYTVNLPVTQPNLMLMHSDDTLDDGLIDKVHGLTGIANFTTRAVLMSATEKTATVKKRQSIGTLSSVLQLLNEEIESMNFSSLTDDDMRAFVQLPDLELEQQIAVQAMLQKHKHVFSSGDGDEGIANATEHTSNLTNDTPIYQRQRRFPPPIADEIEQQCQELNSFDIIERSISPWSSPVVPVRKKDGTIRMCIDYHQLNSVTSPDKFPVPNLADSIFGLHGTNFFTRLNLMRGYYQLPVDANSRQYTAFSMPHNHWQFKR